MPCGLWGKVRDIVGAECGGQAEDVLSRAPASVQQDHGETSVFKWHSRRQDGATDVRITIHFVTS